MQEFMDGPGLSCEYRVRNSDYLVPRSSNPSSFLGEHSVTIWSELTHQNLQTPQPPHHGRLNTKRSAKPASDSDTESAADLASRQHKLATDLRNQIKARATPPKGKKVPAHYFLPLKRIASSPLGQLKSTGNGGKGAARLSTTKLNLERKESQQTVGSQRRHLQGCQELEKKVKRLQRKIQQFIVETNSLKKECLEYQTELEAERASHLYTTEVKMQHLQETLLMEKERSNRLISELKTQNVMVGNMKRKITDFLLRQERNMKDTPWAPAICRTRCNTYDRAAERTPPPEPRKKSYSQFSCRDHSESMAETQEDFHENSVLMPPPDQSFIELENDNVDKLLDVVFEQAEIKNKIERGFELRQGSFNPNNMTTGSPFTPHQKRPGGAEIHRTSESFTYGEPTAATVGQNRMLQRDMEREELEYYQNEANRVSSVGGSVFAFGVNSSRIEGQCRQIRWVPNDSSQSCFLCKMRFIFVLRRKHHCRACGQLVCDSCSPWRDYAVGYGDRRVRVCEVCHRQKEKKRAIFMQKDSIYSSCFNLTQNRIV